MQNIKLIFSNYSKKWQLWLVVIMLCSVFTRFWNLGLIHDYVFDEVYHAFTAKMYALDRYEAWVWWTTPPAGVAYEWTHPPLAKVFMSWGIEIFGGAGRMPDINDKSSLLANNSFGWRFFPALFGVIATFGIFLFTSLIFKNRWLGVLAAFVFTFDLLSLVQSRTAMNDIFAVTFLIFGLYFFIKRKERIEDITPLLNPNLELKYWLLSGIMLGCAIASKWTAFFGLGVVGLYQIGVVIYQIFKNKFEYNFSYKQIWLSILNLLSSNLVKALVSFVIIPFVIYLLSYYQLFTIKIDSYKDNSGNDNSLDNVFKSKVWQEEIKSIEQQIGENKSGVNVDLNKKLNQRQQNLTLWSSLYNYSPYFTNRLYIWWGLQKQMWWYHTNLVATHAYSSKPWTWSLDLRPVWFYVQYCDPNSTDTRCVNELVKSRNGRYIGDIYTMGNPAIFIFILPLFFGLTYVLSGNYRKWFLLLPFAAIIFLIQTNLNFITPTEAKPLSEIFHLIIEDFTPKLMLFSFLLGIILVLVNILENAFLSFKQNDFAKKYLNKALPLFFLMLAFCAFWLPWFRSPRIMFFYHFFPPATFFYPLLGYFIFWLYNRSNESRRYAIGIMSVIVISFVYFYPHVTGILVPEWWRDQYYWLSGWK